MKADEVRNIIQDWFQHNSHDTGWIACSDWTNQHLGDTVGGNVEHNLDANLSDLIVKVLISTDGTDANSFEVMGKALMWDDPVYFTFGINIYEVDSNNIKVQTGASGVLRIQDSGVWDILNTESWYYKIKIWKIGF